MGAAAGAHPPSALQHQHLRPGCASVPDSVELTAACLAAQTSSGAGPGADGAMLMNVGAPNALLFLLLLSRPRHPAMHGRGDLWLSPAMHVRSYGVVLWEVITGDQPDRLRGLRMPECAL